MALGQRTDCTARTEDRRPVDRQLVLLVRTTVSAALGSAGSIDGAACGQPCSAAGTARQATAPRRAARCKLHRYQAIDALPFKHAEHTRCADRRHPEARRAESVPLAEWADPTRFPLRRGSRLTHSRLGRRISAVCAALAPSACARASVLRPSRPTSSRRSRNPLQRRRRSWREVAEALQADGYRRPYYTIDPKAARCICAPSAGRCLPCAHAMLWLVAAAESWRASATTNGCLCSAARTGSAVAARAAMCALARRSVCDSSPRSLGANQSAVQ